MHKPRTHLWKRLGAGAALVAVLLTSSATLLPQKAQAQWAVADFANTIQNTMSALFDEEFNVKEFILDPLARLAAQKAIESIVKTTVNWANSGFNGSPAYATNLRNDMQLLADQVADHFIDRLGLEGFVNSPFRDELISSIRNSYHRRTAQNAFFLNNEYTLNQFAADDNAFTNQGFGINRGGLRAWTAAWSSDSNNVLGAFRAADAEIDRRVASAQEERRTTLSWSQGLFSPCEEPTANTEAADDSAAGEGEVALQQDAPGGSEDCRTTTLGALALRRMEEATNADIGSLVSADEIDEVIGSLLTALMNKMFSNSGLAGTSQARADGTSDLDHGTAEASTSPAILNNTIGIIDGQIARLGQFVQDWGTIGAAAQNAKSVCEQVHKDDFDSEIESVIDRATAGVAKGAAAIQQLTDIKTKLNSTGPTAIQDTRDGFAAYEAFMASNALPTAQEISEASLQSTSNENTTPVTLVMRMGEIQRQCNPLSI